MAVRPNRRDDIQKMLAMYQSGTSLAELAIKFSMKRIAIYEELKKVEGFALRPADQYVLKQAFAKAQPFKSRAPMSQNEPSKDSQRDELNKKLDEFLKSGKGIQRLHPRKPFSGD